MQLVSRALFCSWFAVYFQIYIYMIDLIDLYLLL